VHFKGKWPIIQIKNVQSIELSHFVPRAYANLAIIIICGCGKRTCIWSHKIEHHNANIQKKRKRVNEFFQTLFYFSNNLFYVFFVGDIVILRKGIYNTKIILCRVLLCFHSFDKQFHCKLGAKPHIVVIDSTRTIK